MYSLYYIYMYARKIITHQNWNHSGDSSNISLVIFLFMVKTIRMMIGVKMMLIYVHVLYIRHAIVCLPLLQSILWFDLPRGRDQLAREAIPILQGMSTTSMKSEKRNNFGDLRSRKKYSWIMLDHVGSSGNSVVYIYNVYTYTYTYIYIQYVMMTARSIVLFFSNCQKHFCGHSLHPLLHQGQDVNPSVCGSKGSGLDQLLQLLCRGEISYRSYSIWISRRPGPWTSWLLVHVGLYVC